MTLLEMLDVLEAGCNALQQRNVELTAALGQIEVPAAASVDVIAANVNPATTEAPKRRRPTKRKRKPTKARRKATAKKRQQSVAAVGSGEVETPGAAPEGEEGPKRGKRRALGMSFSKLREAIQARRTGQRQPEETESSAG
ncbi:MAG TPA: hypothetical protein VLJ11_04400 [Bryobacteraceae bacterium]|nr:hypothetical protein [Bryobacteraceae bacterium]